MAGHGSGSRTPRPEAATDTAGQRTARERIAALQSELELATDAARAARLHHEIGRLCEQSLGEQRRAADSYLTAHKLAPEHRPSLRAARRLLVARKEYRKALPLFDAEVRITSDPRNKAMLLYAKGRLLEDALANRADAARTYLAARDLDAGNPAVLKALEQCLIEPEQWRDLSLTYEQTANAVASDPRHRAALIVRRAQLAELHGDAQQAVELYETSLRVDPGSRVALSALTRLHYDLGHWRDLAAVLQRAASQTSDVRARSLHRFLAARLLAQQLASPGKAIEVLESALLEAPTDWALLQELERLYTANRDFEKLAEVLERQSHAQEDERERLHTLRRLGELFEVQLGDEKRAIQWYEAARELAPTDSATLHALQRLYHAGQEWKALLQTLGTELQACVDSARRAAIHAELAEILECRVQEIEGAISHHRRALELDPRAEASLRALERLLSGAGRYQELAATYEGALAHARADEQRRVLLLKLALTQENSLEDPAAATDVYRRLLVLEPDDRLALHGLQRNAERAGNYAQLVRALDQEAATAPVVAQKAALMQRAAGVLSEHLQDHAGALQRLRKVLDLDPKHVAALRRIERIYQLLGYWEDLVDTQRKRAALLADSDEQAALILKMVEVCEQRIGDPEQAFELLSSSGRLEAMQPKLLRELADRLRQRQRWRELVPVLEAELNLASDPDARALAAYRIGELYETQLEQREQALDYYQRTLGLMPSHPFASEAITRLHAKSDAWRELVRDLQRQAAESEDRKHKVALLMRQGWIWWEQLKEPQRAVACFEAAIAEQPGSVDVLLALEPLYRHTGNHKALARTYASLAEVLTCPAARASALRELARLHSQRSLSELDDQKRVLEAICALLPDDEGASVALEELLLRNQDREGLRALDELAAEHSPDPIVASAHKTRLAEAVEGDEDSDRRALELFKQALDLDPANVGAMRGLARLAERGGNAQEQVNAKRLEAKTTHHPQHAANLLVDSARLNKSGLRDTEAALEDLEAALERCPEHEQAALELMELLSASEQSGRLVSLLTRAAKLAGDPDRAGRLWCEIARIENECHGNIPAALGAFNRALQSAPANVEVMMAMARLFQLDGQWNEAAQLLQRVVQLCSDREALREAHLQLAELYEERLGDRERALTSLQAATGLDPESRPALRSLARLHSRNRSWDQAAQAAALLVRHSADPGEKSKALRLLAEAEKERGNDAAAASALTTAVKLEGPAGAAASALRPLVRSPEQWRGYVRSLQQYARERGGKDAALAFVEMARVEFERLDNRASALRMLRRGLEANPDTPELHALLASALRKGGDAAGGVRQLSGALTARPDHPGLWRELARCQVELGAGAEQAAALAGLMVLGDASDSERAKALTRAPRVAGARPDSLRTDVLEHIGPPMPELGAAPRLLELLGPALGKLFPRDLEAFGVSARDQIPARSGHSVRTLADRLAAIFGVSAYELYVHRAGTQGIVVELGETPAVLVPEPLVGLPEPQQAFLLARPLAVIAQGAVPLLKLEEGQLKLVLAAAVCQVHSDYAPDGQDSGDLTELSARLGRTMGWRGRKSIEPVVAEYVKGPKVHVKQWLGASRARANRAALLASDDVVQAVEAYRTAEPAYRKLQGPELVRTSHTVADLLALWASEAARSFRQRAYEQA